jgi:hypothetical protein
MRKMLIIAAAAVLTTLAPSSATRATTSHIDENAGGQVTLLLRGEIKPL